MIFRQFNCIDYDRWMFHFCVKSGVDASRTKESSNLFGWGDRAFLNKYTNSFQLELKYET